MNKRQVTQLSYDITGYAIKVHKELGPGLLEVIYEACLKYELEKAGHSVVSQMSIPIIYDELELDVSLKLDLLVDDIVVVELKAVEMLLPVHKAQLLTYMHLLKKPQGLLINFHTDNIVRNRKPLVNRYFSELDD